MWIVALAAWFFVLYNIERFHEPINIASFVYVYAAAITGLLICIRPIHAINPYLSGALLVAVFVMLKAFFGYDIAGANLPLTVTEACTLIITIFLSRQVVAGISEFEKAATDALLIQLDSRLANFDMGQGEIYREIRRARQFNRPLALVALSPTEQSIHQSLNRFIQEVQQKAVETYVHARVADVISQEVSHCDLIARRNDHFIMILPETDREGASTLARRLKEAVESQLGVKLQSGTACFPDQEVTFTGLLDRAEAEMRSTLPEPRTSDLRLATGT